MRPLIAVPHWRAPTWERTQCYYRALASAGAEHVIADGPDLPSNASALLLTGGVDVDPKLYGEKRHPRTDLPNCERDQHELRLLRQALDRDLPVLCICRGHELLNVAMGGTLLQHIEGDGHRWLKDGGSSFHEVTISGNAGPLASAYGAGATLRVNSRHHQGITVDRVAPGLRVVASSQDGLVEALESTSHRWVMGIQWHPERPELDGAAEPLWRGFVAACWI